MTEKIRVDAKLKDTYLAQVPLGRLPTAAAVAVPVCFSAVGGGASYITGVLSINGGCTIAM